mmetsp:Transcript_58838/g.80314  ORF Transcript_58838/g.80314 Transcript_58838/m.80314 type:complete len:115 (+) Transcript_58838:1241-1585(+)
MQMKDPDLEVTPSKRNIPEKLWGCIKSLMTRVCEGYTGAWNQPSKAMQAKTPTVELLKLISSTMLVRPKRLSSREFLPPRESMNSPLMNLLLLTQAVNTAKISDAVDESIPKED